MLTNLVGDCLSLFEVLIMRPSCCFACSHSSGLFFVFEFVWPSLVSWNDKAKSLYYVDFASYPAFPADFLSEFHDGNKRRETALGVAAYLENSSALPASRMEQIKMLTGCNGKQVSLQICWSCLGYCPLWDLVRLYQIDETHAGLDLIRDTLFDAMHVFFCHGIPFCVWTSINCLGLLSTVQSKFNAPLKDNSEVPKPERSLQLGGVRSTEDKAALDIAVSKFPKTSSMKAAQFPNSPSQYFDRFKGKR